MQERSAVRTRPVVVVDNIMLGGGGVAEDADVDIQPITRAGFVPAKVFRSRSMNTPTGHRAFKPLHFGLSPGCVFLTYFSYVIRKPTAPAGCGGYRYKANSSFLFPW